MKKIDKEKMAIAYVQMGKINLLISEEYNQVELKDYLEMEVVLNG